MNKVIIVPAITIVAAIGSPAWANTWPTTGEPPTTAQAETATSMPASWTGTVLSEQQAAGAKTPIEQTAGSAAEATLPSADAWWRGFGDPLLDSLISEAEDGNFNLEVALRRMDAARRQVDVARSGYYPQVSVNAAYERARHDGASASTYSLGASLSWEIDLFGKIRTTVRRNRAQYRASRADWVATMQSLCSQVAATYVGLRMTQSELAVAQAHIGRQDTIVNLAQTRYECGLTSKIDVDQALTVLYSTEAAVPQLKAAVQGYINSLALLLGVYPDEIAARVGAPAPLPEYAHPVALGVPAELLRRRPDILAAEQQIEAAAAAVGIARKDYLPSLSLQGTVGVSAGRPGDMFTDRGFEYSVAPTLSWTLFDGFARRAGVAAARDDLAAAVATYNYTVLNAYCEVANALENYRQALEQAEHYQQAADAAAELLDLSLNLYTQGLEEFTVVANAQVDLLSYTNSVISSHGAAMTALIDLYKALGGGYNQYLEYDN